MEKDGDKIKVTEEEASNKTTPQGVRWVLGISLFLALAVMTFVWIIPALTTALK
ncbi:MAG: hypothetical protein ITG03_08395 [Sphingorhabdus sp.]|jgi:hypothetical protein|nr:hypothetical protein [Sphingorhabdus sp.]